MKQLARCLMITTLALLLIGGSASVAHAATINVGCNADELIAAINTANADPGSTLHLAEGCLYKLQAVDNTGVNGANGLPQIGTTMTINGNGATIQREPYDEIPHFRILQVNQDATLHLSNVTLRNGINNVFTDQREKGGALANYGALTLTDSTLQHNLGGCGGAVWSSGQVTVENTLFVDNLGDN